MELRDIIEKRRSVKNYDSTVSISDAELKQLFELVKLSPSSFNLQHWRFVVVRDPQQKAKLQEAAMGQAQVGAASATIVVLGKLGAHEDAEAIFADAPEQIRKSMVPMIHGFYTDKHQIQRDEAIRSASLASMTLMLTAWDMGFATGPMIGFDPARVATVLGIPDDHIPVMLIALGRQSGDLRPRSSRWSPAEMVHLDRFDGPGLE